ncbi:MAG: FAD-binding protein, partial [Flavobacteriales bacterium]|nr:FAD-binding protein [Flavobacteriales bacterium]
MPREIEIRVYPQHANDENAIESSCAQALGIEREHVKGAIVKRRSIDARQREIFYQLRVDVYLDDETPPVVNYKLNRKVSNQQEVAIIGAGPAGLFAALKLLELGLKPVIFERGKDVRTRRRDLAAIHKEHRVDPDSNYCFGEGGA